MRLLSPSADGSEETAFGMAEEPSITRLLAGVRIVELAEGTAAAFCGKVLADLGAEVVMMEPPEGHPRRRDQPLRDGVSARFCYLSAAKAVRVVSDDAERSELIETAQLLITDLSPERVNAVVGQRHLIVVGIRPYGADGPRSAERSHHLTLFHSAGESSTLPSGRGFEQFPDRAPIQIGSDIAYFDTGWNAAAAALAALYDYYRSGIAQRIDVSVQETELSLNRSRMNRLHNEGVNHGRERNRYGIYGMTACLDGWAQIVGMRPDHWDKLLASTDGEYFRTLGYGTVEARDADEEGLGRALTAWCAARPKSVVVRILADLGVPAGIFAGPHDLLTSDQLAHREFFRIVDDGAGGSLTVPGVPFRLTPATTSSAARRLSAGRMLEGVRILDFTWAAAGPYATLLLGFLGADVIKVESRRRLDPARSGFLARYDGVDASPIFNELGLNKQSVQLDWTDPDGLADVQRLVDRADVVVDNFRPGVMARFGLGPHHLLERNPRLVVASSSANGATGPDALGAGFASIFAAAGGLSDQTGYPDGPPTEISDPVDFRSGTVLVVAIIAALLHATRTGQGHQIDLSSREVVVTSAPDAVLAHALGVPLTSRRGNAHPTMSPHGVYRCTDGWVAIAAGDQTEREALQQVVGDNPDDAALQRWAAVRGAAPAAQELQHAGVAAGPVLSFQDLADDPHLAVRGVFVDVEHPVLGRQRVMGAPWRFSSWDRTVRHAAPLLGADNDIVLGSVETLRDNESHRQVEVSS